MARLLVVVLHCVFACFLPVCFGGVLCRLFAWGLPTQYYCRRTGVYVQPLLEVLRAILWSLQVDGCASGSMQARASVPSSCSTCAGSSLDRLFLLGVLCCAGRLMPPCSALPSLSTQPLGIDFVPPVWPRAFAACCRHDACHLLGAGLRAKAHIGLAGRLCFSFGLTTQLEPSAWTRLAAFVFACAFVCAVAVRGCLIGESEVRVQHGDAQGDGVLVLLQLLCHDR